MQYMLYSYLHSLHMLSISKLYIHPRMLAIGGMGMMIRIG